MLKNALPLKLVSDDVSFAEKVKRLIALHIDLMIEHPELPEFAIKELPAFAVPGGLAVLSYRKQE